MELQKIQMFPLWWYLKWRMEQRKYQKILPMKHPQTVFGTTTGTRARQVKLLRLFL